MSACHDQQASTIVLKPVPPSQYIPTPQEGAENSVNYDINATVLLTWHTHVDPYTTKSFLIPPPFVVGGTNPFSREEGAGSLGEEAGIPLDP